MAYKGHVSHNVVTGLSLAFGKDVGVGEDTHKETKPYAY